MRRRYVERDYTGPVRVSGSAGTGKTVVALHRAVHLARLSERIETAIDESYLQEIYDTERHLLYVACTRARDRLLVTGVEPASEFLGDLAGT